MSRLSLRGCILALLLVCAAPLHTRDGMLRAQGPPSQARNAERIWGRVLTEDGQSYEGFIRLTGSSRAASWADIFEAERVIPDENYQAWLEATQDGEPSVRTIELRGYRVSWEEPHPDFETAVSTGIRVGRLAALIATDDDGIQVIPRSGGQAMSVAGTDSVRTHQVSISLTGARRSSSWQANRRWSTLGVEVEDLDRGHTRIIGSHVSRIEFAPAPPGARAPSPRLHGTVTDRSGQSFTGFITWRFSLFQSQALAGLESDDRERNIPFQDIQAVEKGRGGTRVTLTSGEEVGVLERGSDRYRRVRVSDPALGRVDLEWDAFRSLQLHDSPGEAGYDAFDEGHPLFGTVVTQEGEEITGRIRWDADEEWSWEILDGRSDDVDFSIEFGKILHIERGDAEGARVTLIDGRTFELTGSNDVGGDNKGIFVFPPGGEEMEEAETPSPPERSGGAEWRYVAWEDFGAVRFRHGDAGARRRGS